MPHHDDIILRDRARGLFATETVKSPFLPVIQEVSHILRGGELGRIQMMGFKQSYAASAYTSGWNRELKIFLAVRARLSATWCGAANCPS